MNAVIFNPLEEFVDKYKDTHLANVEKLFDSLVKQSGVDIEQNRQTVQLYQEYMQNLVKLRKKRNWYRFLRVLMCITALLIPVVIWKITPIIRDLKAQIEEHGKKSEQLLAEAKRQMQPLNSLFTDRNALDLIQSTIPMLSFEPFFSVQQEMDMKINYDFHDIAGDSESTISILSGHYNENPFLFENKLIHTMGMETYHGYKTIYWTETHRDSDGELVTETKSQTLHATVTKPKPFYNTQVVLNYCAQGGPDLSFSRDASHLDQKNEKKIERKT